MQFGLYEAGRLGREIVVMATVDIIVPTYNTAKYLPIALDSVLAQTFEDWRILLIDDGSTDNTADIVASYQERLGSKLVYIKQANGGVSAARNNGIRHATAEFLALLDADDVWLPCRLTESLKSFEGRPSVGLSYGFLSRITPDGEIVDTFSRRQENGEGRIAPYIYMRCVDLPCSTIMLRRRCVDEVGVFDETLLATEDRDLWLRIAFGYEVALVPEVIAYYRISPNSLTGDPERMLTAQVQFIEKHYGAPGCGKRERRIALSHIYRQRAEAFGARRQWGTAVTNSLRALTFRPFEVANIRTAASLFMRGAGWNR
jgi:glycosyltransferase involved in cell wall biosynthesis